ncbi:hypothetical protein FIBSPDRAFT_859528 [Athelia psychrophila]|uniref:Uncharacterized protein n=1 Tax=Athelia psychrophila TaxID=1759441 RepID=A0A166L172_9AGAM|nr:hypothetical protein FIBSPDRAFT_859528 [Fibularhizoctonia sp. CBS 109695]
MGRCHSQTNTPTAKSKSHSQYSYTLEPTQTPSPHPRHSTNRAHPHRRPAHIHPPHPTNSFPNFTLAGVISPTAPAPMPRVTTPVPSSSVSYRSTTWNTRHASAEEGRRRLWDERGIGKAEEDVGGRCYLEADC